MNSLKTTEKGENQVCEIMERLMQERENETRWETQRENVLRMLNNGFDAKCDHARTWHH